MLMNRKSIFLFLFIALIQNASFGQMEQREHMRADGKKKFGPPLFLYNTYCFMSQDDSSACRVDVYVSFANDILQFIKERQGHFSARYDLFVSIFDKKGNHIREKSARDKILVNSFEETNKRSLTNNHRLSFELVPGKYKLSLNLTDYDTQKSLRREKELEIKGFGVEELSLSEIVFADEVKLDSAKNVRQIIPNLDRNFTNPKSLFWAYFEIYPVQKQKELRVVYTIFDAAERAIVREEKTVDAVKNITPFLLDLSKYVNTPGRYTLIINVGENDSRVVERAKFSANWSNFEISKMNINTAISALKEFIPSKEFKFLEDASDSSKEQWFVDYWKERDPTPNTEENELRIEFYRRVDFANNYFTVNAMDKEGWKTDRGNIYIKYGPPTDVERHLDELNLPPYEIWYYENLERTFVFEDRSGIGDFQLVRIE